MDEKGDVSWMFPEIEHGGSGKTSERTFMKLSSKDRKYAAYLARKFYSKNLSFKEFIDEFPYDSDDPDPEISKLLDMIEHTPKKGGLFGVSEKKYREYILKVYELIEKLEH